MKEANTWARGYDGLGRRVLVEGGTSSTWTVSLYSGMDIVYEVDQGGAATKYMRANGMLLAKVTPTDEAQDYLGDHIGSSRKVLDASRDVVFQAEYEPLRPHRQVL